MMSITRDEIRGLLTEALESLDELPAAGISTPIDQTFRIGEGRFLQLMMLEADQDIFDRQQA